MLLILQACITCENKNIIIHILTFVFAEPPFFEVDNAWPLIINVGDI